MASGTIVVVTMRESFSVLSKYSVLSRQAFVFAPVSFRLRRSPSVNVKPVIEMFDVNAVGVVFFVMLVATDPSDVVFRSSSNVIAQAELFVFVQYDVTTRVPVAMDMLDVNVSEQNVFETAFQLASVAAVPDEGADWIMSRSVQPNVVEFRK